MDTQGSASAAPSPLMLLGQTTAMVALRAQLQHLAAFDTVGNRHVPTLLLQGETGTGKGLVGTPDAPHATVAVPETVAKVLLARIDRLPDVPRRILQTAAVLGREVSPRLLGAIWDDTEELTISLQTLQSRIQR